MRADLTRPEMPDWCKYLFPCDSDDHHWLLFEWDTDGEFPATLDVVPCVYAPNLRQRIRMAFKILRGRKNWTSECVLLNEQTARDLQDTIAGYLAAEETKRRGRTDDD